MVKQVRPLGSATRFPKEEIEQSISERFEAQVTKYPSRLAIKTNSQALTYDALNRAANRLARAILAQRGESEEPVVLLLRPGATMIVGMLAVLKAGKIWVPLDSSYPRVRITHVLEDAQAALILTDRQTFTLADELTERSRPLINVDELDNRLSDENLGLSISPDALASILYTSGSTGKPKGVVQNHRNLLHLMMQYTHALNLTENDRQSLLPSYSHSAGVNSIFRALLNGAAVLPYDVKERGLDGLAVWLREEEITIYNSAPTLFRHFVNTLSGEEPFPKLRVILLGGEVLHKRDVEAYQRRFAPHTILLNNLGCTELSSYRQYFISKDTQIEGEIVPVGYEVEDRQVLLLDEDGQEIGTDRVGQIAVRSPYLALGYWRKPDLTRQVFTQDPRGGKERVYLTGDLGRMLPDGRLLHLGRKDGQVKVRGYRIEIAEVETALLENPQIEATAVAAWDDESGDRSLVAYVVLHEKLAPTTSELHRFLRERLPEYMVPSVFMVLDALPMTSNGKVDRQALPEPDRTRPDLERSFVAPRSSVEETLAGIWVEVLGLAQVGIHDDFFELGGHSLLATRVISRVRDAFQVELPMRCIFETPTIAALATAITASQLNRDAPAAADKEIPRRETSGPCPLSFAQQRLWFLDQLEPGTAAYNFRSSVRLRGPLAAAALQRSLDEIVRRHEVLRTTFSVVDSQPVQIVAPIMTVPLSVSNLTSLPESQREAEAQHLIAEEVQRPFDLSRGPLLRATLLQLGVEEHILLLTMHHIVTDGWSMGIFYRELSVLYEAYLSGASSPLPEPEIQYADFAVWQRQWLQGKVLERQLAYWKQKLGDSPATLDLPTDRPRPAVQTFHAAHQTLVLSEALSESLRDLSQRERVTLSMLLLAMFKVLLSRYAGQEDVVVGSPIAGRTRLETEGLIGFFVNTLVLRTDLCGNPSFQELLERVRDVTLGAYAHQDLPFEKLVEALDPERDLSRTPLFQVFFNVLNLVVKPLEMAGLTVGRLSPVDTGSKFDLTLYVADRNQRIQFDLVYNADLFDRERMAEMLAQLELLASQIIQDPGSPIQAYSLVTPRSRHLLPDPVEVLPEPWHEPVTEHFARWMVQDMELRAIQAGDRSWAYAELATSAHALAKTLCAHGVERGVVVAVVGPRSFGLIASMVGVLWSGGVLLNLDANLPPRRQKLMLREAGARHLLYVGMPLQADEWMWESAPVIRVEPQSGRATELADGVPPAEVPLPQVSPNDPAYLFFTSGSTGVPKGVLGCHKGLAHFVNWQRQTFDIGPSDRSAQLTGLSFDVVLRDVFTPLTSGATLCLPAEEEALDPSRLLSWMERERISMLHTVPSLAQWWLQSVPPGVSLQALRWVFFAGEPLTERLVRKWREAFPQSGELVNLYGPTETTLAKCYFHVPSEPLPGVQPVGSPMPQTQALVLGENNRLCGVGEPGEIVVRTPFRSLGYTNASEENQRRFVRNPFREDKQDVIYYTGDRGRYRPDGTLDILGRIDHQVKLRGVRIELGGIEAVLGEHPAVWQTVVLLREDTPGEKGLVAYVLANNDHTLTAHDLRLFARQRLPEPMVPSAFVLLDTLPLMANGKVDRRALPQPDRTGPQQERAFTAPRTPVEEVLAGIWAEVLDVGAVGIHDDFFDLGGHSLLAAQVIARVRDSLLVDLPLRSLFDAPTVAGLAESIEALRWLAQGSLAHTVSAEITREEGEL